MAGRRLQGGQGGPFSPFPTLGVTPFGASWLPHALVDGKPGIPGAGEKMIFADISCEPDVLPMLGSAEMQHVWEAFAGWLQVATTGGLLCSRRRVGAFSPADYSMSACMGVNTPVSLLRKLALPSGLLVR